MTAPARWFSGIQTNQFTEILTKQDWKGAGDMIRAGFVPPAEALVGLPHADLQRLLENGLKVVTKVRGVSHSFDLLRSVVCWQQENILRYMAADTQRWTTLQGILTAVHLTSSADGVDQQSLVDVGKTVLYSTSHVHARSVCVKLHRWQETANNRPWPSSKR